MAARAQGHDAEAIPLLEEALAICRARAHDWLLATSTFNLGQAAARVGQRQRGRRLIEEALALYRELGDEVFGARMLLYLGYEDLVDHGVTRAKQFVQQALADFARLEELHGLAEALDAAAVLAAAEGADVRAARITGSAEAVRQAIGFEPMPYDREIWEPHLAAARARTGPTRWQAAYQEGKQMSSEEAVALARGALSN
jgi:tetratricopeptide (TPR) repeat protein